MLIYSQLSKLNFQKNANRFFFVRICYLANLFNNQLIFFLTISIMKYLYFSLSLLWFSSDVLIAQNLNYDRLSRNDWSSVLRGNQPLVTKKSDNIEQRGSPFIFDAYEKGIVIVSDSIKLNNDFMFKINAEDNEIWILQDKKELVLTDKQITGLDLTRLTGTLSFRKILLPDVKKNPSRFVEVLFEGKNYALIKNTDKIFEPANYEDKGLAIIGRNYNSYTTVTSYYILNHKKQYKKVALKKGDLYKVNPVLVEKNRDAINKFCKDNQIANPLEEADAIQLMEYLDKLE